MQKADRVKWTKDFYGALAVELHSHLANGSEFIHLDGEEDCPEDVVNLRFKILKKEVVRLQRLSR